MTLSNRILLGLAFGIGTGLFLGEPAGVLSVAGRVYVRLLQMTVLPYVLVSLVAGLGSMSFAEARQLALRGGAILLSLWAIAFAIVLAMPVAFPQLETASFFSTTLVQPPATFDFVELYIPSNPFHSLAESVVPAVVLFSIALGVALMGMPGKEPIVGALSTLADAIMRVAGFVVRLTPYGVFAIAASAAGTMTVDEFEKVQVYLLTYIAFALLLALWILPGLVHALTGIRHRDVLSFSRDALVTAFATGSDFVVLPILVEQSKALLRHNALDTEDSDAIVDVVIPVSHNFPHTAKILTLSFILFAGWFTGEQVTAGESALLGAAGVVALFASVSLAIPFLLDLMQLPQDLFELFLATGVVNARFGTLVAAMHGFVLALLVTCALTGRLQLRAAPLVRYVVISLGLIAAVVVGARAVFAVAVDTTYHKDEIVRRMDPVLPQVPVVVHREPPVTPATEGDRLERIRERGSLRVCYAPGSMPFAYFNGRDELVGFDVEMAHDLARGLGVTLDFVPVPRNEVATARGLAQRLEAGYCDIAMTLTALTPSKLQHLRFSRPVIDLNLAFVVLDHRRREFRDGPALAVREDLRVAMIPDAYVRGRIQSRFPGMTQVEIQGLSDFFEGRTKTDALLLPAEVAATWTLLYPRYAVVVPEPPLERIPTAYPLPRAQPAFEGFVAGWLELKTRDETIDRLYEYWILGREAENRGPRWSILRNVLGWDG